MSFLYSLVILAVVGTLDAGRIKCDYTYVKDAGGYFKFQEMPSTFENAKKICSMEGGILASPINDAMQTAMTYIMNANNVKCAAFTGFSLKSYDTGIFTSIERVHLSEVPHTWAPNEPDNYDNKENCIIMLADGTMADVNCDEPYPYMCFIKEVKAKSLNACGPKNRDYSYYSSTGSCYKFHRTPLVYDDAAKACQAEGGHLVVLNGDTEVEAVKDLFSKNPTKDVGDSALIGFRFIDGLWITLHGETIEEAGYAKWGPGEPNNAGNNQKCGALYRTGLLDDIWCDRKYVFICEKEPQTLLCK